MSVGKILQSIIIEPIRLIFEFIFGLAYRVTGANAVLAIISLSIIVNLVIYPLYKKADELQEKQKEKENKLKPSIEHIKKTFKGDEAYMMLQTLYRQNDYSPLSVLNGSVSLLLQIPFFMAAYQFLHDCPALEYSFGIFKNLSKPDAMLRLGSFDVNVLPIAMTLINLVSVAIYTKGQKFKEKIQLLIMAL
ncbi:MAG: YidC/Oxa1 family membrane protein insertase, partial [Erysipelotrichaceae bacterium]|nr:YidC/Oxa1 family membrane protein insertase [Erysipelotrichaceae bacterium]